MRQQKDESHVQTSPAQTLEDATKEIVASAEIIKKFLQEGGDPKDYKGGAHAAMVLAIQIKQLSLGK